MLSPHLFAVYLDDLFLELEQSSCGCCLVELFVAAILYADDLAILAPNITALQILLDVCIQYGKLRCIEYNPRTSK